MGRKPAVIKLDCLYSDDDALYRAEGIPVQTGLSNDQCPDHYFAANAIACRRWAENVGADFLFLESAGLCNRCSPHVDAILALCVIDNLSGYRTPAKVGPMLRLADGVVITKGDVVSQAERDVFTYNVRKVNPSAFIVGFNGITGQGSLALARRIVLAPNVESFEDATLRYTMPSALCSYCTGQVRIGARFVGWNPREKPEPIDPDAPAFGETPADLNTAVRGQMPDTPYSAGLKQAAVIDISGGGSLSIESPDSVESIAVVPGHTKSGNAETVGFALERGQVYSVVGPTGSGKSRLLADIECLAQDDTPTGRRIRVNGQELAQEERDELDMRLTSQVSQNMNFVMDLSVRDFIAVHAESLGHPDPAAAVDEIFACANTLTGERFELETNVTQLSGGQSRALMIADVAVLGSSPIVLVDEIENAGIDRLAAVQLLADKDKMVVISTHDPVLALQADKRVVLADGGIVEVLERQDVEVEQLPELERVAARLETLRNRLRAGERIDYDLEEFLGK